SSGPICGVRLCPISTIPMPIATNTAIAPKTIRRRSTRTSASCSIVAIERLPTVARGQTHPRVRVDERRDEPHRAVAEQNVAADAVLAPHFVGVAERVVRGVVDHFRLVVRDRPAVGAGQAAGAVATLRP